MVCEKGEVAFDVVLDSEISLPDFRVVDEFPGGARGRYQPLTKPMFTALRDEVDPTIAAISTLMTAASFMLVLIASTRQKKNG